MATKIADLAVQISANGDKMVQEIRKDVRRANAELDKIGAGRGSAPGARGGAASRVRSRIGAIGQGFSQGGVGGAIGAAGLAGPHVAAITAAVAASAGLATLVKREADVIDNLAKMARRIGIATNELQAFAQVAALNGVEMDKVVDLFKDFNIRTGELFENISANASTFQRLGLDAAALEAQSTADRFITVASALNEIEDQSVRQALGQRLFGESAVVAQNFLTNINDVRGAMQELRSLGLLFRDGEAEQVETMNDSLMRLGQSIQGIIRRITVVVAPLVTQFADAFGQVWKAGRPLIEMLGRILLLGSGFTAVTRIMQGVGAVLTAISPLLEAIEDAAMEIGKAFSDELGDPMAAFQELVKGAAKVFKEFVPLIREIGGWIAWLAGVAGAFANGFGNAVLFTFEMVARAVQALAASITALVAPGGPFDTLVRLNAAITPGGQAIVAVLDRAQAAAAGLNRGLANTVSSLAQARAALNGVSQAAQNAGNNGSAAAGRIRAEAERILNLIRGAASGGQRQLQFAGAAQFGGTDEVRSRQLLQFERQSQQAGQTPEQELVQIARETLRREQEAAQQRARQIQILERALRNGQLVAGNP